MNAQSQSAEAAWLHALRNAVNSSCVALDMARRALDAEDPRQAMEYLAHAEHACARSRDLLGTPPPKSHARMPEGHR